MKVLTDDLISRAEAIDAPEKFIKDCNPYHFVGHQKFIEYMDNAEIGSFGKWQFANGFNMGLTAAEVAIKKLPSAQQWIQCSERYPDMDERVLVYTVAHDYHVWDCMSNRADNYFWEDEEGLYHDKYEADLWMPLPQPYEVEK